MNLPNILIAILSASWFQIAHSAEIRISDSISNKSADRYIVVMSGEITRGDYDRILSIVLYKENLPVYINIESPGGDIIEAIKLGRLARRGLIGVGPGLTCNSACAFLVFSSINHDKGGEDSIGLHRPSYNKEYFADLSLNEANKKYKKLDDHVLSYLKEMGVPTAVSEKIMSTPSNRVDYMTIDEYIELAGSKPPAFHEWLIAQCGAMSEQEKLDLSYAGAYEITHKSALESRAVYLGTDDQELLKRSRKGEKLSEGYRNYLINRINEIGGCERKAIKKEQAKIVKELIGENSGREPVNPATLLDPWPDD